MSKKKKLLAIIKYDFATNGKDTGVAMSIYCENRCISFNDYEEQKRLGLNYYSNNTKL